MEQIIKASGELLATVLACIAVVLALQGLQRAARRYGDHALSLLRIVLVAVIAAPLAAGLPQLYPVLAPWHALVLGACFGLVFGAIQWGGSMRWRSAAISETTP